MSTSIHISLLDETVHLFRDFRVSMVKAMTNLHTLKDSGEWEERYGTWGEFVEDGLGISQGFASKLLTVHRTYLIEGGLDENAIAGVDYEKLYAARALPGTPIERVAMAKTLSRRELKQTQNETEEHGHIPVTICKICSIRL